MAQLRLFGERETLDVLVVDDDRKLADVVRRRLRRVTEVRHRVGHAPDVEAAAPLLAARQVDVVIVGVSATDLGGLARLTELRDLHIDTPVVVVHHGGELDDDLETIITGAQDVIPLADAHGARLDRVLRGAIARKRVEAAAMATALTDPVTGLGARAWIESSMERAVAHAEASGPGWQVAVLFCDLDRFKQVNDTLGHSAGDLLLRMVADRLRGVVRAGDPVGRFGGDEFVIVLEGHHIEGLAHRVALRAVAAMERPFEIEHHSFEVRASIGLSLWQAGETADRLLERADVALYRAKQRGRNQIVVWDDSIREWADREQGASDTLSAAIESDTLVLAAHPVWDLRRAEVVGRLVGAEWAEPDDGRDLPSEPPESVAARHGQTVELALWVMDAALVHAREHDCAVWVRLPHGIVGQNRFVARLADQCELRGVDPERLTLAVAERDLSDDELVRPNLDRLDQLGIAVAMRDFGSGTSSLTLFASDGVDEVLLAPELCRGIADDPLRQAVLQGVMRMADAVGQQVVACGIEDERDLRCVTECGCHAAQTIGDFDHEMVLRDAVVELEQAFAEPAATVLT